MKEALERAITALGTQTALADAMTRAGKKKIVQQNISWWLNESGGIVPADVVLTMELVSGVSRHDLRPDVFGPAPAGREAA